MKSTALYLFATSAVMIVCLCDGANIRVRRSNGGVDLDLDSNGFCKTARSWMNDCNQCWCPEGGAPACTAKGCMYLPDILSKGVIQNEEAIVPAKTETILDEKCVPGTKWKVRCNECFCTDNGLSLCTKIGC